MKKRKMKFERKVMAFLLALVMVIGFMPGMSLTTYADDDPLPFHVHDDIDFTAWTSTNSLPSEAGNYYLTDNVTISQPWKVNNEINLCLNGYGIQKIGNESDEANSHNFGGVIVVEAGGNLNISDCNNERIHYITLTNWRGTNVSENGNETEVNNGNGVVKISGGFITGGYRTRWDGGAVLVDAGGSQFTMKSGTILGNIAKQGGAIMVKFSGTNVLLKDVAVIYNLSTLNGGGVQNYDSNLTVDNCVITNNCCDNTYSGSGSRLGGGGIHFESGSLTISGNTVVDNNTYKGAEDNLYMRSNKKIAVGALTEGANIGVSMQSVGVFTNSPNSDNNDISKFTSDNQNYAVGVNNAGQLYLGTKRTVTFNTGGKGTAPESQIVASGSKATSPSDPVAEGYTFDGWYKEESLSNKWNFGTDVVTGNITLYAKWNKSYTVTFNTGGKGTAPESQIVASGSKATSPSNPVAEGYTFDGWYKEESLLNKWDFDTDVVSGDITLYAKWNKSYTVTFKVVNGTWDDGEGDAATADKTVVLTGGESDALKLATDQIPAVGNKPNSGYEAGNWNVTPNTETEITSDTVYTYTFASSAPSGDDEGGNTPGGDTPTPGGDDEGGNTPGGDTPTPSDSGEGGSDTPASDPVTPSGDEGTNGSQGTDGATGYVKDVTGTNEASGNYTFGQSIVNNGDLKTLLSLSDSEVNEGTKVWLDVADLGNNAPDSDKALVESAKGDYTIGTYLDINLFKKVGNNEAVKVTKTNGNVEVSLVMPENLRKEGRTYGIVRVHDDMATLIAASYAGDSHLLTFKTDGFSTYAIVYKDGAATGGNTPSNTSASTDNSSSGSNNATTTTSTVVPKTDGMSGIMVWGLMLILSLSTLGVVAFMRVKENR